MNHHGKIDTAQIAVIGAGMAGVTCAHALQRQGFGVTLFEKSRGIGGRLSTRRGDAGGGFDHGAQYITTQTPEFAEFIAALQNEGAAAIWKPRTDDDAATAHRHPWFVGTPGMSALLKPLAVDLDIRGNTAITALDRSGDGWQLRTAEGALAGRFDVVVSTAPAAQAGALLAIAPALQRQISAATMAPCWALMLAFRSAPAVHFDTRRFDRGAVAWLARQASRPGRAQDHNAWVLHASAQWSAEHLELAPNEVAALLRRDLAHAIGGTLPEVAFVRAHRWRHAMTTQALGQPFLANAERSLFAGGDWCLGARVECAYQSGVGIAAAVTQKLRLSA